MAQLPIEFNPSVLKRFGISKDNFIDVTQICNLWYSGGDLNFVYPDNATKLFTTIFNNPDSKIFEIIIYNLLVELSQYRIPLIFYKIKRLAGSDNFEIEIFNNTSFTRITTSTVTITLSETDSLDHLSPLDATAHVMCLFEYDENDFGHYGSMFYNAGTNVINIFDSMMKSIQTKVTQSYNFFDLFINKLFDVKGKIKIFDIYKEKSDNIYSLEITGGSLYVKNAYILNKIDDQTARLNAFKQYLMGVDNQNQFCYMWAFLNIIFNTVLLIDNVKLANNKETTNPVTELRLPDYSFANLHRFLIRRDIIPVVSIKTFILLLIKYYIPTQDFDDKYRSYIHMLRTNDFFMQNFKKIITNKIGYSQIFSDPSHNFVSFTFNVQPEVEATFLPTHNFSDIMRYFYMSINNLVYTQNTPIINKPFLETIKTVIKDFDETNKRGSFEDQITTHVKTIKNIFAYLINFLENNDSINIKRTRQGFEIFSPESQEGGEILKKHLLKEKTKKNKTKKLKYYKLVNNKFI